MVLIKKKRNVWSSEKVLFFLKVINEMHIVGFMDGKRLRVGNIFKTLVTLTEHTGFHMDVGQLAIKWKNLKAEYYKCKTHNGVSRNDPNEYELYETFDEILGHHPLVQQEGFDSSYQSLSSFKLIMSGATSPSSKATSLFHQSSIICSQCRTEFAHASSGTAIKASFHIFKQLSTDFPSLPICLL
ncbi:hypothetical protein RN001_003409 [Aquatica leii]|uniref:Myb/SANT-like DNA-binding domain-containing protein n=1 Tax=Aquatica leii TaxID=1421715 RepID=A0AAN7PIJ2_9COLE|nr:hypothetical protein RN001_003409 [Aquatica leii]